MVRALRGGETGSVGAVGLSRHHFNQPMKPLALICAAVTGFSPAGLQPVAGPSSEAPDVRLNVPWHYAEPFKLPSYREGSNVLFSVPIDKPAWTNSVFTTDDLIVNLESLNPKVFPVFGGYHRFVAGEALGVDILRSEHGGQIVLLTPGPKKSRDENKRALEKRFLETGTLPPIPGDGKPLTETVALYSSGDIVVAGKPEGGGVWTVHAGWAGFSKRQPINKSPGVPWGQGSPVDGSQVTVYVMETRNCDCCGSPRQVPVRRTWVRVHGHWLEVKR